MTMSASELLRKLMALRIQHGEEKMNDLTVKLVTKHAAASYDIDVVDVRQSPLGDVLQIGCEEPLR